MATRFKSTDLKEMIRLIVREEMTGVVKEAINEVLSERYLKQLAEASVRPRGVGPTLHIADGDDNDVEEAPVMLRNDHEGIYYRHPSKHDDEPEEEQELSSPPMAENIARDEMLSLFFEGTKPLKEVEASVEEGIPLENIMPEPHRHGQARRPMTEVWQKLAGVEKKEPTRELNDREKREEQRLKMLRESLERPA